MRRREQRKNVRTAAMPPKKGELYPHSDAMAMLLILFGYPLAPPPFKKEIGTCYWGLGGNQMKDEPERDMAVEAEQAALRG